MDYTGKFLHEIGHKNYCIPANMSEARMQGIADIRLAAQEADFGAKRCKTIISLMRAKVRTCYQIRVFRLCCLCGRDITMYEAYCDGGSKKSAHYGCVPGLGIAREPWQMEVQE